MNRRERPPKLLASSAAALFVVALPLTALAQAGTPAPQSGTVTEPTGQLGGTPAVDRFQAESTADTLGTEGAIDTEGGQAPVSVGQAESVADPLGGFDDEGALPLGTQPAGTGAVPREQQFGEQGVLRLGQQPRAGTAIDPRTGLPARAGDEAPLGTTIEGQDLPDADLGARGVDVQGTRTETGFADINRAARGVETTEPGGIEQPLEDVDNQARGVRLQGEQVNEELLDVRAEGARGIEPSEGPRAGPRELPFQNVPGGGIIVIPGTGVIAPGTGGQRQAVGPGAARQPGTAAGRVEGAPTAEQGAVPAGQGVTAAGTGIDPAMTGDLEEAEEREQISITGRVAQVSYGDAMASVVTEDHGVVTVHARPQEIALLQPGDFVALNVARVGDTVWISPAARFEPGSADVTAAPGTGALSRDLTSPIFEGRGRAEGVITAVNAVEGLFIIGENLFRAHPAQVEALEPGQMVSVTYGTVADELWAADIRVGAAAAGETVTREPAPGGALRGDTPDREGGVGQADLPELELRGGEPDVQ